MQKRKLFSLAASLILLATLTACGSSSDTVITDPVIPPAKAQTFSGVVADGYLVGATVCSDQNKNKICDAGEPFATTTAGGAYDLTGIDIGLYPILVEVDTNVIDEDTNAKVLKPYVMSAPKPADITKPQVVTPITSLVQNQLEENPTLNRTQAATVVRNQLGVTQNVDLFADFVAEGQNSANADQTEYKLVHATARVIAGAMAESKEVIETAATDNNLDIATLTAQITKMVMSNVQQQLDTIVREIAAIQQTANNDPNKTFDPVSDSATVTTTAPDVTNVAQDIDAAAAPVAVSSFEAALTTGSHWLRAEIRDYGNGVEVDASHGTVTTDASNILAEAMKKWDNTTMAFVPYTKSSALYLVNSAWVESSDSAAGNSITFNADGSATVVDPNSKISRTLTVSQKDVSGLAMRPFAGSDAGELLLDDSATFPAGSLLYSMVFEFLQDEYRVEDRPGNQLHYWSGGSKQNISSLAEVETIFSAANGEYLNLDNISIQFSVDGSGNPILNLFESNYQGAAQIGTGTYSKETIQGQNFIMLHLPAALVSHPEEVPFLVEWADPSLGTIIKEGFFSAANTLGIDNDFNGNDIAFNALLDNLDLTGVYFGNQNYVQGRSYESKASNSIALVHYAGPGSVSQVELTSEDGATTYGTQTTPFQDTNFFYNCMGTSCTGLSSEVDTYFWFKVAQELAAGNYKFKVTLNSTTQGTTATVISNTISYSGHINLPTIASTSMTATPDGSGGVTLNWTLPAVGSVNADRINSLRAVLITPTAHLLVKLPADATSITIPADVVNQVGANSTSSFWRMEVRAYDASGMNYARGRSDTIPL